MSQSTDLPQTAAVLLENPSGEILLLRRGDTAPWMPGFWNLPGGDIEAGESACDAACRETLEEAGVFPRNCKPIEVVDIPNVGQLHVFHAKDWFGDVTINWESSEFKWVAKAAARDFNLVPGLRDILLKLT